MRAAYRPGPNTRQGNSLRTRLHGVNGTVRERPAWIGVRIVGKACPSDARPIGFAPVLRDLASDAAHRIAVGGKDDTLS